MPTAFSTVLPVQLPVCWLSPVRPLKIVDLPTLGFPAMATVKSKLEKSFRLLETFLPVDELDKPIKYHPFLLM